MSRTISTLLGSLLAFLLASALPSPLAAADKAAVATASGVTDFSVQDELAEAVRYFNPTLDPTKEGDRSSILWNNSFIGPAANMAEDAQEVAWIAFLIFLPFLVLPEVLLVYVIFKFRNRNDGRQPATFVHHNKLEIFWTAVPIMALTLVAVPSVYYLYRADNPPSDDNPDDRLVVYVTGKQFAWKYVYPDYGIELGTDINLGPYSQETVVFELDRVARLTFGSEDVNHNWSVPAFGIRKDCFPLPKVNYAWFTPFKVGTYEGQCFELCGLGHSLMMFSAIVVDGPTFERWVKWMQNRDEAVEIGGYLYDEATGGEIGAMATQSLQQGLRAYLQKSASPARLDALRYWAAWQYVTKAVPARARGDEEAAAEIEREGSEKRQRLEALVTQMLTELRAASTAPALAQLQTDDIDLENAR